MTTKQLTVLFVPLDGFGHINSCVGVAEQLLARGHRVVFALERAWKGKASAYRGIEEVHFTDPTRDPAHGANDHWIQYMEEFKPSFQLAPIDKYRLKALNRDLEESFLYTLMNVDDQLVEIINSLLPDAIVVDTYVTIPAVHKSAIPWVWLTSAAPLVCLPSENLPPHGTGYPTDGDRSEWTEFRQLEEAWLAPSGARFAARLQKEFGIEPPAEGVMLPSPYLNMYAYPIELDERYLQIRPLPEKWRRFEHFIRTTERSDSFSIPQSFLDGSPGQLVYVSMGSMGCACLTLMRRLIEILSRSPNRFIFSLGPYAAQLQPLPANMWGDRFVPQTAVLPLVSLVISHGGNNTTLEALYHGSPLLICPLFGDQHDNRQRVTEAGLGDGVANPYKCPPEELLEKVDRLLSDGQLRERIQTVSRRLQASKVLKRRPLPLKRLPFA
ncbi:hypothetical protein TYRP_002023 [Tyrophagus putrescentiae]|nr:hypothetical protein TYRP_002023 [Tyrophagus putrescentiae]